MNEQMIINKMQTYLRSAQKELCVWLQGMLPRVRNDWWQFCVIDNLSIVQAQHAVDNEYSKLEDLDLAALLRVTTRSWYDMRSFAYLPTSDRQCTKDMIKVRNNWSHLSGSIVDKDVVLQDLETVHNFFKNVISTSKYLQDIEEFKKVIEETDFSKVSEEFSETISVPERKSDTGCIQEMDQVYLNGDPDKRGVVLKVSEVAGTRRYVVFVDNTQNIFYEGQIQKIDASPSYNWVDLETLQSNLTAYEINHPSAGNLYALNAARIDFVPYQFRPALKLIKSDEPKILIADSVGVGKTIEAGLIIKELEARKELDNVLIICPKPLVAERKWELEMKRFDEDFSPLNGGDLRQVISDTHRDEAWPVRYNRAIIPYSILDSRVYERSKNSRQYGLLDLDPAPHFDLVIIDEAHHIRNGSLEKDKAYAYKCVRYFCEHADAVVMLTATPLQTSDDDLFTLMNLLRPDVIIDKDSFNLMMRPNEYIYRCSHAVRGAEKDWRENAISELLRIKSTQWGESVIAKNPLYADVLERLGQTEIKREERVKLVSDIESLHSLNFMLNRTRRKDIEDFCVRRSHTVETKFTPLQQELHDELLRFEHDALSVLHNRSVQFMMSTIRRQVSSCIFGVAPYIKDLITRRFEQMLDDPDIDMDSYDLENSALSMLESLAQRVQSLAEKLPEDDPKFDSILNIIEEKQKQENNKIIFFSSFRHTLSYMEKKLSALNYRVAQINGSVDDNLRSKLRDKFAMPKDNSEAIDILLFTEVGSEGLDYQFCDTMINYDLPWNPMRIEQRIGRIDRRGQKSEAVNIHNVITAGTVDADIYTRCLQRIGVFERSIGECEEVLGEIGSQIEKIALSTELTDEERQTKLEQMADNKIRHIQELSKLEEDERALFGFDLKKYTAAAEIKNAESPWLSPVLIQRLVERYLKKRLGEGTYIIGASDLKQIRLDKEARMTLLEDFRKLSNIKSDLKSKWENYLKGSEPMHQLTFIQETASNEPKAFFITPMHPLVKQAAKHYATSEVSYIHLSYSSNDFPEGSYPFQIYAWSYVGLNPKFRIVPVCENKLIAAELIDIMQEANTSKASVNVDQDMWYAQEEAQIALWKREKESHIAGMQSMANYKLESIGSNYRNRKRNLEQKISENSDDKIKRMYETELNSAKENYEAKVKEINTRVSRADIHTALIANGIIEIKRS